MKITGQGLECELVFSKSDGEGWIRTSVQIKAPSFEGGFLCAIEKREWELFVQTLQQLEASIGEELEVSWRNMEANIQFDFILYARGSLRIKYKFSPENFSFGPTLSGTFEADQTFLQDWVRSAQQELKSAL